jgi:hypothetical protein
MDLGPSGQSNGELLFVKMATTLPVHFAKPHQVVDSTSLPLGLLTALTDKI